MPRNLVEISTFTSPITVPLNGEAVQAENRDPSLQALANRTKFLHDGQQDLENRVLDVEGRIVGDEWTYPAPKARVVVLPAQIAFVGESDGTVGWRRSGSALMSRLNNAEAVAPLQLPHGATLTRVRAMVKPGSARDPVGPPITAMVMNVRELTADFAAPGVLTTLSVGSDVDDGTTNWQLLDSGVIAVAVDALKSYIIQLQSGDDGGAHVGDTLSAIELQYLDPGPRNY